ncbi:MAG: inositol 2-dehydrogenase [Deltaproteobacteria bacterium]|nr:inositol 2-dehydrogenase [Deltaproteobacteria bacterium]
MKNLLLLGAGRIGQVHAKNVVARKDARLYGVVEVNAAAAAALADSTGAKRFDTADEALLDTAVDAVLICTSTDTHVEMIVKAARANKPIFCEKPVDLDIKKVDACLAEVNKTGVPLLMGFNRRFDPSFKALRDRLQAGELGKVESIKITSRDPQPPPPAYVKVSGGLFRDMMIHDLDMARYLLAEEPTQVFATGSVLVDPAIGEAGDVDSAMVILKTPSGRLAHIDNSRRAAFGYDQRVEAFGEKGMLQANNPTPTAVVATTTTGQKSDKPFHFFLERYAAAYQAELEHFLAVLDGKAAPLVTGDDGRRALVLADAATESMRTGKLIEVRP